MASYDPSVQRNEVLVAAAVMVKPLLHEYVIVSPLKYFPSPPLVEKDPSGRASGVPQAGVVFWSEIVFRNETEFKKTKL